MIRALLPKSAPFFELLMEQNRLLCEVTELLVALLEDYSTAKEVHHSLASLEAKADKIHVKITKHLSQTFITPIDREDILHINKEQEEAIDMLHNTANRLYIFELFRVRFPMLQLARTLNRMAEVTSSMLRGLSKKEDSHDTKVFVSLHSEGEMLLSTGIAELHDMDGQAPSVENLLMIVKYSQIYDRMEQALRQLKQLCETIEEAVLKNV